MEKTIIKIINTLELDEETAERVYTAFKADFENDVEDALEYLYELLDKPVAYDLLNTDMQINRSYDLISCDIVFAEKEDFSF